MSKSGNVEIFFLTKALSSLMPFQFCKNSIHKEDFEISQFQNFKIFIRYLCAFQN